MKYVHYRDEMMLKKLFIPSNTNENLLPGLESLSGSPNRLLFVMLFSTYIQNMSTNKVKVEKHEFTYVSLCDLFLLY